MVDSKILIAPISIEITFQPIEIQDIKDSYSVITEFTSTETFCLLVSFCLVRVLLILVTSTILLSLALSNLHIFPRQLPERVAVHKL